MFTGFFSIYFLLILVCLPILWYTYDKADSFFRFFRQYKVSKVASKKSYKGLYWSVYYGCDLIAVFLFFIGIYCGVLKHYRMCFMWILFSVLLTLYSLNISKIIVYGAIKMGPAKGTY